MVHIVKTPEKRDAMIELVPPVKAQVHEQECDDELRDGWHRDEVNQAERFLAGPAHRGKGSGPHQRRGNHEGHGGKAEVHNEPPDQFPLRSPQRSETFDGEENRDQTADDRKRDEGGNHQESEIAGRWVIIFLQIVSASCGVIYRS